VLQETTAPLVIIYEDLKLLFRDNPAQDWAQTGRLVNNEADVSAFTEKLAEIETRLGEWEANVRRVLGIRPSGESEES
jgi:hypothetical protein